MRKDNRKKEKSVMEELRDIRDKISKEIQGMNAEELKAYFSKNSLHSSAAWRKAKK